MAADMADKTTIWLDCDTGHDDAFAILLSLFHPQAHILGISTVHGNAPVHNTTSNTLSLLTFLHRTSINVVQGAAQPLRRPPSFAPEIHGASGLDGVTLLPLPTTKPSSAIADVPSRILAQPKGTVHLVATGPLTNVATWISAYPDFPAHLAHLSIMGGAVGNAFTPAPLGSVAGHGERFGNWTPWAEFNIYADPEAAATVLSHPVLAPKTTLIPLDLTHLVRGTAHVQSRLFPPPLNSLSSTRRLFREILLFFADTYAAQFGIVDGPPLHDPLAVWAVLAPEAFDDRGERWEVDVNVTPGAYHDDLAPANHAGQTVLRPAGDARGGIRVPRSVDIDAFWEQIDMALGAAERWVAARSQTGSTTR